MIRVERNDARIICYDKPEYRISTNEPRIKLNLNGIRECFRVEHSGLVKQTEWKGMFGLVNLEPSRLVVVSP